MFNKNVHRSDFKEAIINSLMMFLFMIVFSIIGVFFIFTRIGGLWDLLIGVAFTVPLMYIYFYTGGQEGKREFKKLNGVSVEKAKEGGVRVPSIFKGLLYVAPYAAITVALAVGNGYSMVKGCRIDCLYACGNARQSFGLNHFSAQRTD